MNTITKDKFIEKAASLDNFYKGSDLALYAYARDCNCIDKVFSYMSNNKCSVGEVTEFIYNCAGRPNPQVYITDDYNNSVKNLTENCHTIKYAQKDKEKVIITAETFNKIYFEN